MNLVVYQVLQMDSIWIFEGHYLVTCVVFDDVVVDCCCYYYYGFDRVDDYEKKKYVLFDFENLSSDNNLYNE